MASGGENAADRSMKAMSSEVVDVIVFAIGVDARDVVAVAIESDLVGLHENEIVRFIISSIILNTVTQ